MFGNKNNSTFNIPPNIKEISTNSFKDSENLKEIIITENSELEIIGKGAFMNSGIAKINLPTKLQKIESDAFKDCKNLSSLEIPSNCELYLIENNAFQSSGIEKIDITSCVIQIGSNVFDDCKQLVSISFLNSKLKSIGNYSFQSSSITEIVIPSSVKQIGEFAFNKCDKLKTIKFSKDSDLRYIEQFAFNSVNQLEEIVIPSKVREIGKNAFEKCYKLKKVEFLDNNELTLIDDYAFNSTQIDTLIIGSKVKRIGVSAFESAQINSIQFKDSQNSELQIIDKCAFKRCQFTQILIPSSVQIIEDSAFSCCSNLKSFKFDENSQLRTFGNSVFGWTKIESIDIPLQVDDIRDLCFEYTENLMSIIPQKENEHYSILTDDKMISSLILYRKNIKNPVFDVLIYVNQYLKSVRIPSDVKYISMNAFKNNNLEYLEFSKGSEVDFIHRNLINFQYIKTIVAPLSLINEPSFFGHYANIKQIGINKFTFAGFNDICCVSFPNAATISIEKGCKKMSIIVSREANIIGDELEINEIRKVHKKLLEEDRFPSIKKETEFLYQISACKTNY